MTWWQILLTAWGAGSIPAGLLFGRRLHRVGTTSRPKPPPTAWDSNGAVIVVPLSFRH